MPKNMARIIFCCLLNFRDVHKLRRQLEGRESKIRQSLKFVHISCSKQGNSRECCSREGRGGEIGRRGREVELNFGTFKTIQAGEGGSAGSGRCLGRQRLTCLNLLL